MYIARRFHIACCWAFLILLPVQFALAGYGVMGGDINVHEEFGGLVLHLVIPILLLVSAGIGRMGWEQAGWSFLLFVIITFQIALVSIGRDADSNWIAGLHPAIAFLTWPYVYFVVLARAHARETHDARDHTMHKVPTAS